MTQALSTEERRALGWPDEPAGVDTIRGRIEVRPSVAYEQGKGYVPDGRFHPTTNNVGVAVETAEGGYTSAYLHGLRKSYPDPVSAIAAGRKHILKQVADARQYREWRATWGRNITAQAEGNRRKPLGGWSLNLDRKAVVGEVVLVWGFGGYRYAYVVEVTKGRGIVAGYATPASPYDHHFTRTTKYAQNPGVPNIITPAP